MAQTPQWWPEGRFNGGLCLGTGLCSACLLVSSLPCGPRRVLRVCSGSAEGGAAWHGGGRGCWNQDFRLSTSELHLLVFPVNHFQTVRRGEEGHYSQQGGLQRYSLSFFCSNNSFLFLLLPLLPFLAQMSFRPFSLPPLHDSSACPSLLLSLWTPLLSEHGLCSACVFSTPSSLHCFCGSTCLPSACFVSIPPFLSISQSPSS